MNNLFEKLMLPLLVGAASGCVQVVEIENEPARITSVGPIEAASGAVAIRYTVRDFEGDDQTIRVEICEAPDKACGLGVAAQGGDPTGRVPTVPEDTDVLHEFRWSTHCGRYVDGELTDSEMSTDYVARVWVLGMPDEALTSDEFSLAELEIEEQDCE